MILVITHIFNIMGYTQKNDPKVRLGYLTANFTNPSYINGKLREMTQITYGAKLINGKVVKGERLKNSEVMGNTSIQHITFRFNETGEMISATYYDDGNPIGQAIVDNENGKISKIFYTYKDTLRQYHKFIYDNIMLKEVQYCSSENNTVLGKTVYYYDKDGNLIKSETFNSTGTKSSEQEFTRDIQGRILIATYKNREGEITGKVEYRYGTFWDPIAQDVKISNGKEVDIKERREPEYDDKGNLIKFTRFTNDIPKNITERTYLFYKE